MSKNKQFSRRAFLKQVSAGLLGLFAILVAPAKNRLRAFGLKPADFDESLRQMPQLKLRAPESIVNNQAIFKIPLRAVTINESLKVGGIVVVRKYKEQTRLHSVGVTIENSDLTLAYIKEKPNTVLPVYHLSEGTIILDDLRKTLTRLRRIDAAELRARFIKIGEEG